MYGCMCFETSTSDVDKNRVIPPDPKIFPVRPRLRIQKLKVRIKFTRISY